MSEEITINIKGPSELKLSLTVSPSLLTSELKAKINEQTQIEPERQRLIYSGKVLKDEEPLSTYKVQNNHTLHLVKGAAKPGSNPTPSASNATSSPSSTNASAAAAAQARGVPTNLNAGLPYAGNPLAQLEGAMGHGYGGGTFNPFAQMPGMDGQNLNDPNAMANMLNNPEAISQAMSMITPEMMDQIIASNPSLSSMGPQVREMMRSPMMRQMMSDPNMIRQMMAMQGGMGGGSPFGGMGGAGAQNPLVAGFGAQAGGNDTPSTGGDNAATAGTPSQAAANPFGMNPDMMRMLMGMGGGGGGAGGAGGLGALGGLGGLGGMGGFGGFGGGAQQQTRHEIEDDYSCDVSMFPDQFRQFDMVTDCSDHYFLDDARRGCPPNQANRSWLKKIRQEWSILEKNLPETIYIRTYEERMDLMRASLVGAPGTPYHDGLFFFDIYFPPEYPREPPLVHYHSGGLRLNPNLYESGKVCLSLLNTWTGIGSEVWNPGSSTILQVLLSIQALVLNDKPYFNEAGYDSQIGKAEGEKNSISYNENAFLETCKSILYLLRKPPKNFEALVEGHFRRCSQRFLNACKAYMDGTAVGCAFENIVSRSEKGSSTGFKIMLAKILPKLVEALAKKGIDCRQFTS